MLLEICPEVTHWIKQTESIVLLLLQDSKLKSTPRLHHVHRPCDGAAFLLRQHQSLRCWAAPQAGRDGRRSLPVAAVSPQSGRLRPLCCVEPGVSPLFHREAAQRNLLHPRRKASLWTRRAVWILQQGSWWTGVHPEETLSALRGHNHPTRRLWQPERKHAEGVCEADLGPGGEALHKLIMYLLDCLQIYINI